MASVLLNKKITYADLEEDEGLKIELKKSRTYLVIHKVNLWPRFLKMTLLGRFMSIFQ